MDSLFPQTSLRDLISVVCKRLWGIVTIVVVALMCSLVYVMVIKEDAYETSAKILVKLGQEQAPPATMMGLPMVVGYRNQEVNTEIDILQSTELIAQVVDHLRLDKPGPPIPPPPGIIPRIRYEVKRLTRGAKDLADEVLIRAGLRTRIGDREFAILMLQRGLAVAAQRDSNVVHIKMIVPFREGSSVVLNTLLERYLKFRATLYDDQAAVPFFQTESDATGRDLIEAENELQRFETKSDITSLDKQKEVLLGQIAAAQTAHASAKLAFDDAASKVERLTKATASGDANFAALGAFEQDSFLQKLLLKMSELQTEREKLRLTDLDETPRIRNNRDQFAMLQGMVSVNLTAVRDEKAQELQSRSGDFNALRARLASLHEQEAEWKGLKRRAGVLEDRYVSYRKKLAESTATANLSTRRAGNVAIVERAMDPIQPVGMRKLTMLQLSAAAGLFLALLWVTIAEFFDHGVYGADALERHMGVPVIATIPSSASQPLADATGSNGTLNDGNHRAVGHDDRPARREDWTH